MGRKKRYNQKTTSLHLSVEDWDYIDRVRQQGRTQNEIIREAIRLLKESYPDGLPPKTLMTNS